MIRLGPPSNARRPTVSAVADNGDDVLVPYVARQRLLLHRLTGEYSPYLPPKVYFGRASRHVEDRKRPNQFATLSRWLKMREWSVGDYLLVASMYCITNRLGSPQELTKRYMEANFRSSPYRYFCQVRSAILVREVIQFCRNVRSGKSSIGNLPYEEFPALLEIITLQRLGYTFAEKEEQVDKLRLAACQYLANTAVYDSLFSGYIPKSVLSTADQIKTEILAHGGLSHGSE